MIARILVLNGPNLNLLGAREPHIYGRETLADIDAACVRRARSLGLEVDFRQSNAESALIDWIHEARCGYAALIINAGAYTHTSVAILDALLTLDIPIIEVHVSNLFRREPFRHTSYVSKAARAVICGLGGFGYELALEAAARYLAGEREN